MGFWQDARYAVRNLRKHPGFSLVAVFTLAIGIGANTSIFSLVNTILIRPLPFHEPDRLIVVRERAPKLIPNSIPAPAGHIPIFQRETRVFESVAGFSSNRMDMSGSGEPQRVAVTRTSWNTFPLLGVDPQVGRTFQAGEDHFGSKLAILSNGLWKRQFGQDPKVIGRTIHLDREPYTVIGVMPDYFQFPVQGMPHSRPSDIWVPLALSNAEANLTADNFNFTLVGRAKPGVTLEQIRQDSNRIIDNIRSGWPAEMKNLELLSEPVTLTEEAIGNVRLALVLLFAAVGLLLLIACANVANLLLSRAASRNREISIRAALGAGRWRVIRQLLTESVTLGGAGGILGILIAWWALDVLSTMSRDLLPRTAEIRLDWQVLAFSVGVSLITGVLFGIIPAFTASRTDLTGGLRDGGRGTSAGFHRSRMQRSLVVGEVALALVLLVGAGLLFRSLLAVQSSDPGFRPEHLLSASVSLPDTQYKTGLQVRAFHRNLQERISSTPGVQSVAIGTDLPVHGRNWNRIFSLEGQRGFEGVKPPIVAHTVVNQDYFRALEIAVKAGRTFDNTDREETAKVLVINETMQKRYWPDGAVGKRIKWGTPQSDSPWFTIIGVVADIKEDALDKEAHSHTYQFENQMPDRELSGGLTRTAWVAVRGAGTPQALTSAIRTSVWSLDRELPIMNIQTMETSMRESIRYRSLNTWLLIIFAGAALLLASIGIYGVMAYSVTQRTQEIGIRMALGAARMQVLGMVMRQALGLALAGVAIGLTGAAIAARYMASLLYGVQSTDTTTFAGVAVFLLFISALATYLPARRATRIDPGIALRYE